MQDLSLSQKRVLIPACQPGWSRLVAFVVVGGLAVALLDRSLPIPDVLTLLGAVALVTLALTGSTATRSTVSATGALLARVCASVARHVLARAAVTS